MLQSLFRIETLLAPCQQQHLILTPNNRLRSKIIQAWGHYQVSQGHNVWQPPRVYALEPWLEKQWQTLLGQGYQDITHAIASADKERILWHKITADSGLLQPDSVATQAASALNTLHLWGLPLSVLDQYRSEHHSSAPLFTQWAERFLQQLAAHGLMPRAHAYAIIGDAFVTGSLNVEPNIALVGFDDIPPLIEQQLHKATTHLYTPEHAHYPPHTLQRIHLPTPQTEMQAAATWAREILANDSDTRIGIIVPNLGQCRHEVERAFVDVFEAHSLLNHTERYTLPFNFSAGTPLGSTPLITDTLALLQLNHTQWPLNALHRVLFSPFWGDDRQQLAERTQLMTHLERLGKLTISASDLRYWAQRCESASASTGSVFHYLEQFARITRRTHHQQLPSTWVDVFLKQLDALGWPGQRRPDSQEYQQTQLWYQLLESVAGLDDLLQPISLDQALYQLGHMANHMPFQAQVPDSPIQILGILEGAGLHFSHCWILGLHQQAWPPTPAPNPLLPTQLQREYNMPHADHFRELAFAQSLTENYRHCAPHIVMSSPCADEVNEQELLPSPLITDIPLVASDTVISSLLLPAKNYSDSESTQPQGDASAQHQTLTSYYNILAQQQSLESIDCTQGPALSTQGGLKGGANVIKDQAGNPFDSFAIHRLGAKRPPQPNTGFSAIEQGNSMHHALASLWHTLKDHATLLATDEQALELLIKRAVTDAIKAIQQQKPDHLGTQLCQLEIERQCQLLAQWLAVEQQRPPFTVVAIEEERTVNIANNGFTLRIDRVDQLADGSYLIIDYKTGETSLSAWKGERLKEPQLPLYALTYTQPVAGISFAQINVKAQTFKGLSDGRHPIAGVAAIEANKQSLPLTWEDALHHWGRVITELLQQYQQGDCRIHYRDSQTINYAAELLPLNRFNEADDIRQWLHDHNITTTSTKTAH